MQQITVDQFTVWYENREEAHQIKREIFSHHTYYFETDSPTPVIIDAGAHIGLATLYFKKLYPAAKIIAIEPHPTSFKLLQKNVSENRLSDVTLLNAALVGHKSSDQTQTFFADTEFSWFSTASIHEGAWNKAQHTAPLTVPTLSLTEVLKEVGGSVDLLKLDIEGAEQAVLGEARNNLANIAHIICEYHMTDSQNREKFIEVLERAGYEVTHEDKQQKFHAPRQLELIEATRE